MIFQPSCLTLYFIFSINLVVFYEIYYNESMTPPRYYGVTHFLADFNENCTAYVKLNSKIFLFMDFFLFSEYLLRKLRFITSIVQLPYTSPSIPFGPPIRVVSVSDTFFTYLRILFQHKKIIVFTKNGENQGRSLSWPPHIFFFFFGGEGSSTRSSLIFWDTFPPYLRILFQQIFFCNF